MYCPACGSEERQPSQYCRACGTDLRNVRITLERPDAITASAVSAREQISQAFAEQIRQIESSKDLKRVAEDVLPQVEKFIESPEEKRLRRIRAGVVMASIGLGATVVAVLLSIVDKDFFPMLFPSVIAFFIGLGIIVNGLAFTLPRKQIRDRSDDALAQYALDQGLNNPSLAKPAVTASPLPAPSVTEHTTKHLANKP